jgi:hypothetical protein
MQASQEIRMTDRASMPETVALRVPNGHSDAPVLNGGLAGLPMGIQLKRQRPETRVLVAEKHVIQTTRRRRFLRRDDLGISSGPNPRGARAAEGHYSRRTR